MDKTTKKFNLRAFVALMLAFSCVGLPVTGIANHFYGFSPLTVARHAWMSAHNFLGFVFAVFAIWHVMLNRRTLWSHVRGPAARLSGVRAEALAAGAILSLGLWLFVGHAFHVG